MKLLKFVPAFLSLSLFTVAPAIAENIQHTQQLLSTKECPNCNLAGAGLVLGNLAGSNLQGANLAGANLSRANLMGADLRGANLSGAILFGANLIGANLTGAIINGTDLRKAYVTNANFTGVDLNSAFLQGAIGLSTQAVSPEQFYQWGIAEAQRGAYRDAIEHYNKAIALRADFAAAYFGRSMSRADLGDYAGATEDAAMARQLFQAKGSKQGVELSEKLIVLIKANQQPRKLEPGSTGGNIMSALGSIASVFLRLMLQ